MALMTYGELRQELGAVIDALIQTGIDMTGKTASAGIAELALERDQLKSVVETNAVNSVPTTEHVALVEDAITVERTRALDDVDAALVAMKTRLTLAEQATVESVRPVVQSAITTGDRSGTSPTR